MAHEINNPLADIMQNVQVVVIRLTKSIPANEKTASEAGTSIAAVNDCIELKLVELLHNE